MPILIKKSCKRIVKKQADSRRPASKIKHTNPLDANPAHCSICCIKSIYSRKTQIRMQTIRSG